MRYFLIDRVTELVVGQQATGLKCVSLSDPVLHDHFPDFPTMPGALIVEAAAQLAGFLLEMTVNQAEQPIRRALLAQIELAKFHERVGPGTTLEITATIAQIHDPSAQIIIEARAGDTKVARAKLTFMMQVIDSDRVNDQRRYIYELWTRDLKLSTPVL